MNCNDLTMMHFIIYTNLISIRFLARLSCIHSAIIIVRPSNELAFNFTSLIKRGFILKKGEEMIQVKKEKDYNDDLLPFTRIHMLFLHRRHIPVTYVPQNSALRTLADKLFVPRAVVDFNRCPVHRGLHDEPCM